MEHRNRSEGWRYAKLSGHENENILAKCLRENEMLQNDFLLKIGKKDCYIKEIFVGGLNETLVESVLCDHMTKSKTDMKIILSDGSQYNVSIKKSKSGQVYLIDTERFIQGYEAQFEMSIPKSVRRAITLFWGCAEDTKSIIELYGRCKTYEKKKHRITEETLRAYDNNLAEVLLQWFKDNIINITKFCFSCGCARNHEDWANIIWYKNMVGDNQLDHIFLISDLSEKINAKRNEIAYGMRNGGTTIQLPFGFVQWHGPRGMIPGKIQFHHQYDKIKKL